MRTQEQLTETFQVGLAMDQKIDIVVARVLIFLERTVYHFDLNREQRTLKNSHAPIELF
jgi:hypothetical protein